MSEEQPNKLPEINDTLYALLINQMRANDILMALLTAQNPTLAKNVLDMHADGTIIGPSINYNGTHVADEMADD